MSDDRETQALKGDLLDELHSRGWSLIDMNNSTFVQVAGRDLGDLRKPRRSGDPSWRVRRNDGRYSYGETPWAAILQGIADEQALYATDTVPHA